jgi:hypothetical protein
MSDKNSDKIVLSKRKLRKEHEKLITLLQEASHKIWFKEPITARKLDKEAQRQLKELPEYQ